MINVLKMFMDSPDDPCEYNLIIMPTISIITIHHPTLIVDVS